jgi:hypothetical protein
MPMPTLIVECPYCRQPTPQHTDMDSVFAGQGRCRHCHEEFLIKDNLASPYLD